MRLHRATLVVLAISLPVAGATCTRDHPTAPPPDIGDPPPTSTDTTVPQLDRTVFLSGLSNPWDFAFLSNGEMLLTERPGRVRLRRTSGDLITVAAPSDVVVSGEGGMLGMTIDPQFATNRFVYTCFSSNRGGSNDNRLVRWTLSVDGTQLGDRTDILVGLPWANGGRHSGCRPRFGPDGALWVGTGDAAVGANAQDLQSLGGKLLRITRDGAPAPGNPLIAGANPRIYSYGHRNVQGLAFHPVSGATYTVEHGPSFDDEVNRPLPGSNGGWNPIPGYNESVSMTDLSSYPTAQGAVWSTGSPARGSSGGTFLSGANWKGWNGAFVIGQMAGTRLVVLTFDASGAVKSTTTLFSELGTRLRTPSMGPDGALYISTDVSGGGGQIWRIAPR